MRARAQEVHFAKRIWVCQQADRPISQTRTNTQGLDDVDWLCLNFDNMLFGKDSEHNNNM
jgi:hypothetical protein